MARGGPLNRWVKARQFLSHTIDHPQCETDRGRQERGFTTTQRTTGAKQVQRSGGGIEWQMEAWASGPLGNHPQRRMNLDLWPFVLAAHPPDLEERDRWAFCNHYELWQLRLAALANLHFTPEHMSGRGPYPLGCAGPPPPPLAWPACLFVTSSTLTLPPSVCSSICLSSSINLFPVYFTKTSPQPSNIQPSIQALILPTLVPMLQGSPGQRWIHRPIIQHTF